MPIYEYACHDCGREFETLVRGDEQPKCPKCGDRSVWWTIAGPGHAKCSHVNSCGYIAPLIDLCT